MLEILFYGFYWTLRFTKIGYFLTVLSWQHENLYLYSLVQWDGIVTILVEIIELQIGGDGFNIGFNK